MTTKFACRAKNVSPQAVMRQVDLRLEMTGVSCHAASAISKPL
jgi:hypothetical protein